MSLLLIRVAGGADHDAIWKIFHAIATKGDTCAFDPQITRAEALAAWFAPGVHTYVADAGGEVVGTYLLKPNQPGLGSHVANAAFMVASTARGLGVGKQMGEHCLAEARRLGFRAMQFNLVVSTNIAAVALWKKLGFEVIGTLPGAFRHATLGYVDAYVMYRSLDSKVASSGA